MLDNEIIFEYAQNNKSIQQISKEYNLSWNKVKSILVKNSVDIISRRNQYNNNIQINNSLFAEVGDEATAYWLGLLYADGNIRSDRNEISLSLQEQDYKTIYAFQKFIGCKNSIRKHTIKRFDKQYISYDISFSSKDVKHNLENLGCIPKKSLVLTFPTEQQVSDKFLYDFIRGYVDGDGYVQYDYEKHRYRIIILGTNDFLSGLLKRTGWERYGKIYKQHNIFSLELSNKKFVKYVLEKLYKNSVEHIERKYQVFIQSTLGQ